MTQLYIASLRTSCRSGDTNKQLSALLELIKIHDEPSLPDIVPLLSSFDSPRIHAALQTMALCWPLMSRQVQEIENKLA